MISNPSNNNSAHIRPSTNGKKIHQLTSKGAYKDARNLLARNRFTNLSIGILKYT